MSARQRRSPSSGGFPHQNELESLFDEDFSSVQVATGEASALSQIGAGGLASGEQIAVPTATPTLDLMAHELTHVVQQRKAGTATAAGNGLTSVPNDSAEKEAQAAESKALNGQAIEVAATPTGSLMGDWGVGALIGGAIGSIAGPGGALAGAAVGGMIQNALSDDEEHEAPATAAPAPAVQAPQVTAPADPGAAISGSYAANSPAHPSADVAIDLSTEDGRIAALNNMTQDHNTSTGDPTSEDNAMCGATSILAGAMLGGGNDGISAIIGNMSGLGEGDQFFMDAVQEKLANGEALNQDDLYNVQLALHHQLRAQQAANRTVPAGQQGVHHSEIQRYLDGNEALTNIYAENNLSLAYVDNTGADGSAANHFVMRQTDDDGNTSRIYNPWSMADGNQVRDSAQDMVTYDAATQRRVLPTTD